ncbi:MAG: Yip1 family protein [Acidobacteriota bacterium]
MTEENSTEFQPPPPPEKIVDDPPQMSEPAMIGNIFLEPSSVFVDQRRKPRFIIGGLLVILCVSIFQIAFVEKFGLENIVRARFESSKRTQDLPADQKEKLIAQQSGNVAKYITYGATPVVIVIAFFIGGLIYWGGSKAMGGDGGYLNTVAVWIYASVPPTLVFLIGNMIVLFLKSADDIDLATSQGGLLKANLGFFVDPKSMPVIAALLGSIDFFAIWGWILAAIGLQKVAKISSGAAWTVVLIVALVKIAFTVLGALFF